MTGEVEHLNWYDHYIKLRSRAGIEFPGKHSFLFIPVRLLVQDYFCYVPKHLGQREIFWKWVEKQKSVFLHT